MWRDIRGRPKKTWMDFVEDDMDNKGGKVSLEVTADTGDWKKNKCCTPPHLARHKSRKKKE